MSYVLRFTVGVTSYDFSWGRIESGTLSSTKPQLPEVIATPDVDSERFRVRNSIRPPLVVLLAKPVASGASVATGDDVQGAIQGQFGDLVYQFSPTDSVTFADAFCMELTPISRVGIMVGFGEVAGSKSTHLYRGVFRLPGART